MRISQSASTTLSRRWWRTTCPEVDLPVQRLRVLESRGAAAPTLPASTEMKCTSGAELTGQLLAAVVARVQDDDRADRRREAQRCGGERPEALRQV